MPRCRPSSASTRTCRRSIVRKVEHLKEALSDTATQLEAGEIIRSLIDRIELTPEGDALAIKLYGDLAQIIAFSETSTGQQKGPVSAEAGPILSVVAGTRNCLDLLLSAGISQGKMPITL
jgi:hypothetical protein